MDTDEGRLLKDVPSGGGGHHQPIVVDLVDLLGERPHLVGILEEALKRADWKGIRTLREYLAFLDRLVTFIPTDRDLSGYLTEFHYLIACAPEGALDRDPDFSAWMVRFAREWGSFLDTPASEAGIPGFMADTAFRGDDYVPGPSGWLTFNQFFAREVKPGRRPVEAPCDDRVVVSPADSVFKGLWPLSEEATLTAKGFTFALRDLLAGSPHWERFRGGVFMHAFLDVTDYHRYHAPVRGRVLESRKIPGRVSLEVWKRPDGTLATRDGEGFQFTQDRGLLVLDGPVGLVAVLPIGMAQVSSVNLLAEPGVDLAKGECFGWFAFGGSDIVLLFERDRVAPAVAVGTHLRQGQALAAADPP